MEDKFQDISKCRKYLKQLEELASLLGVLPDIDDISFDFYEYVDALIDKEYERVNKN